MSKSNAEYIEAAERIMTWQRPLLLTHTRPDGDALGSMVALSAVLREAGRQPGVVLYEPPPRRYDWLTDTQPIDLLRGSAERMLTGADGVVIADTCTYNQLVPVADWLRGTDLPKMVIDHHVSRDDLAASYLIDESASAACLILFEMFRAAGWSTNPTARTALFTGISTDTGWFRFSNTDSRTLHAAADLTDEGVKPWTIFEKLYQRETQARFRLMAATFDTMELCHDGRIAVMQISLPLFAKTGASFSDTEDLINFPLQIDTVEASILLVESEQGQVRVSFRSKPPEPGRQDRDVAAIAATFGGGGHRRAAGAKVNGALDDVKRKVITAMTS